MLKNIKTYATPREGRDNCIPSPHPSIYQSVCNSPCEGCENHPSQHFTMNQKVKEM